MALLLLECDFGADKYQQNHSDALDLSGNVCSLTRMEIRIVNWDQWLNHAWRHTHTHKHHYNHFAFGCPPGSRIHSQTRTGEVNTATRFEPWGRHNRTTGQQALAAPRDGMLFVISVWVQTAMDKMEAKPLVRTGTFGSTNTLIPKPKLYESVWIVWGDHCATKFSVGRNKHPSRKPPITKPHLTIGSELVSVSIHVFRPKDAELTEQKGKLGRLTSQTTVWCLCSRRSANCPFQ